MQANGQWKHKAKAVEAQSKGSVPATMAVEAQAKRQRRTTARPEGSTRSRIPNPPSPGRPRTSEVWTVGAGPTAAVSPAETAGSVVRGLLTSAPAASKSSTQPARLLRAARKSGVTRPPLKYGHCDHTGRGSQNDHMNTRGKDSKSCRKATRGRNEAAKGGSGSKHDAVVTRKEKIGRLSMHRPHHCVLVGPALQQPADLHIVARRRCAPQRRRRGRLRNSSPRKTHAHRQCISHDNHTDVGGEQWQHSGKWDSMDDCTCGGRSTARNTARHRCKRLRLATVRTLEGALTARSDSLACRSTSSRARTSASALSTAAAWQLFKENHSPTQAIAGQPAAVL